MLVKLAYYTIGGFSLVYIFGILAFLMMLTVMMIPFLRERGWAIKFNWHMILARWVLIFTVIHLVLALSIKYGW